MLFDISPTLVEFHTFSYRELSFEHTKKITSFILLKKFAPFFRPVYDVLQKRLDGSFLDYCLKPEVAKVEIAPFAYMRGRTFENAVVILDDAQNVTVS